jgi:hypothetical protein
MASSNAVTEPPRMNIPRIDGETVKPASSITRATLTESALDRNSLLEIGILVAGRLVDDRIDLLTLLTIWTLVPSPRHFIIVSPLNSHRTSLTHGSVNCLRIPEIHPLVEERQKALRYQCQLPKDRILSGPKVNGQEGNAKSRNPPEAACFCHCTLSTSLLRSQRATTNPLAYPTLLRGSNSRSINKGRRKSRTRPRVRHYYESHQMSNQKL